MPPAARRCETNGSALAIACLEPCARANRHTRRAEELEMGLIKRSAKRIHWIVGASLVLTACATVPPPEYQPDHPANPAAPAGAEMPHLSTLATYKSFAGQAGPGTGTSADADQGTAPQAAQPSEEGRHEHEH
jgi:hypothetical protein